MVDFTLQSNQNREEELLKLDSLASSFQERAFKVSNFGLQLSRSFSFSFCFNDWSWRLHMNGTETSAATAAARTKTKRRSVNQPPTKVHHLHDQVASRLIRNAEKALTKVATVTQPPPGVDMGEALTTSMMITITKVPRTNASDSTADGVATSKNHSSW
jgi:hypothetical protein